MLKEFAKRLKERQLLCAAAMGYGLLAMLRPIIGKGANGGLAANLAFDHWDLDRKLREQYRAFGASDDEVWRLGEISKAALRRTAPQNISDYAPPSKDGANASASKDADTFVARRFAETIIEKNYLQDDFRNLMGINSFNDISWFNKESFESLLFYGTLFFVLENDSAYSGDKARVWLERAARIAEIAESLEKAKTGSGYQLELLMQLLAGKKIPDKKEPVTKLVEKKTDVKKTSDKKTPEKKTPEKKPAEKKVVEKKIIEKKAIAKKTDEKKPVAKKAAVKKPVEKKTAAKKNPVKKTSDKKAPVKKTVEKKTSDKKTPVKKTVGKKTKSVKRKGEK
jgi:hypothetical protein